MLDAWSVDITRLRRDARVPAKWKPLNVYIGACNDLLTWYDGVSREHHPGGGGLVATEAPTAAITRRELPLPERAAPVLQTYYDNPLQDK